MENKLKHNQRGFTLVEVMIGIMILTVAIVSATNLLVGLQHSNQANMTSLQAYYYAVEGIEGVRNIRDSDWLHNRDWLGGNTAGLWGANLAVEGDYSIALKKIGLPAKQDVNYQQLNAPWVVAESAEVVKDVQGKDTAFSRTINISRYDEREDALMVTSKVTWELNGEEREVELSEILTNWKNGVL